METKMTPDYADLIPTRRSLLNRLKDLGDEASWKDFFDSYWRLIYSVALKSGLRAEDAEDVVQETVISVLKTIHDYNYDPNVTFKGWLRLLVRRRVVDHFRRQRRRPLLMEDAAAPSSREQPLIEQIADPCASVLDAIWEEEWQRNLVEAALERLRPQVSVKQYQVFYLRVIKGQPVREVARGMGVTAAYVHLARHRTEKLFKRAVAHVEMNQGQV
jgi:RNA polymerase sigma factor (sigma-70 family)